MRREIAAPGPLNSPLGQQSGNDLLRKVKTSLPYESAAVLTLLIHRSLRSVAALRIRKIANRSKAMLGADLRSILLA